MSYLIDTDWVIYYLKGRQHINQLLTSFAPDGLAISLITYGEIFEGIYYGGNPKRHEQAFLHFLRGVDVLPLNKPIMKRFARIRGVLRQSGQIIGDPDILIAATAIHYDLTLLSNNIRHFSRIPNLKLYQGQNR
jgi:tRNA(fMet)-specific endonuclease VapC